jgi:hypothetical protein
MSGAKPVHPTYISLFLLKHLLPVITIVFERVDEVKNYQLGGNHVSLCLVFFFSLFAYSDDSRIGLNCG